MEEEKKNQNNTEHKNRPHHKKGYFITPDNNASLSVSKPAENKHSESASTNEHTNKGNYKNRNRKNRPHHHNNRPQNAENTSQIQEKPQESPASNEASNVKPSENAQRNNHNHKYKKNNRNHHSSHRPEKQEAEAFEKRIDPQPFTQQSDEYEEVVLTPENEQPIAQEEQEDIPLVEVVGIKFKSSGKTYYFDPQGKSYQKGGYAIVETARGLEYGEISLGNTMVKETDTVPPIRPVIRLATPEDKAHHEENKKKEDDAFKICNERIIAHKLDMKLIDAQYTFDNSKLLFYFTSAGRVDFRELVKDLASLFRTRIELRQIGIRDEAKLMGGLGMCGRPLCCTLFLSDFGQVSIKMAKEQNLSLNSAKISGICGRLMCCLRYEYETYEYEIKRTPPVDSTVKTPDGIGTVTEIFPLSGKIKVRLSTSPDPPQKTYHRDDVVLLQKKQTQENE